jgi:hypothetical protein
VLGETLAPSGSGSINHFLLICIAWYVPIRSSGHGGTSPEGATVVGLLRLVDLPLTPFSFVFSFIGRVFVVPPALSFVSKLVVVSCGCYINIAWRGVDDGAYRHRSLIEGVDVASLTCLSQNTPG